ncbi:recombinase XerC [Arthrobacter sp. Leaf145]|nr:recombinase XerC [Arthrobacter sp. Leaf145]
MDIELYEPLAKAPRVPVALVDEAVADAALPVPRVLHRTVARSVARGWDKTKRLRLERLARVVMSTDSRVTDPMHVWSADWSALSAEAFEALDSGIRQVWGSSVSTRNAMRDSVRSVVRESLKAGLLTHDAATPMLNALEPEKQVRDEEKQARGHVPADRVKQAFHDLAKDKSLTARRDTALIALLVGAGLRREEAVSIDLADLDVHHESVVVHGKGGTVCTVPLAPGVRRAIRAWLAVRGGEPGPLITPLTRKLPVQANTSKRMATNTVAQAVARRFGDDVQPHDLRRTFTGDLLESGADLSTVSKILGHVSPAITAGYDRRGQAARLAAVEKLYLPVEDVSG